MSYKKPMEHIQKIIAFKGYLEKASDAQKEAINYILSNYNEMDLSGLENDEMPEEYKEMLCAQLALDAVNIDYLFEFSDEQLRDITYIISTHNIQFIAYKEVYNTYKELLKFKDSKINQKYYERDIEKYENYKKELERVSGEKIPIRYPQHPSQIKEHFIFQMAHYILILDYDEKKYHTKYDDDYHERLDEKDREVISSIFNLINGFVYGEGIKKRLVSKYTSKYEKELMESLPFILHTKPKK